MLFDCVRQYDIISYIQKVIAITPMVAIVNNWLLPIVTFLSKDASVRFNLQTKFIQSHA